MLADTRIELEARDLVANRQRRWSVEIGRDLFGMFVVDIEFGRIGTAGRRLRHVFRDHPEAQAYVGRGLRRRATENWCRISLRSFVHGCMQSAAQDRHRRHRSRALQIALAVATVNGSACLTCWARSLCSQLR